MEKVKETKTLFPFLVAINECKNHCLYYNQLMEKNMENFEMSFMNLHEEIGFNQR